MKKKKKNAFCNSKKTFFFNYIFLATPLALHFQDYL
jgi:hypothetical protein